MQTTLRMDDKLMREAKVQAARDGVSLTRWIEEAVRRKLRSPAEGSKRSSKIRLPTVRLGLKPGISLAKNSEIWDQLDLEEREKGRLPRA